MPTIDDRADQAVDDYLEERPALGSASREIDVIDVADAFKAGYLAGAAQAQADYAAHYAKKDQT